MPVHVLKRLIFNLLVLPYDAAMALRDWYERLRGRYKRIAGEYAGSLPQPAKLTRVAIAGVHPNRHSMRFLVNLLDGLAANGFFVLAVTDAQLPDDLRAEVLAHCHHLIQRYPGGRDFGSYKLGWHWIENNPALKDIDTAAFVNDSLYYSHATGSIVAAALALPGDWLCLFENFQTLYHTQSFFQIFRGPVLRSPAFHNFWRNYVPSSVRMRIIKQGEVGLTKTLYDAGFQPRAVFDTRKLRADILAALDRGTMKPEFQDVLNLTLGFQTRNSRGTPAVRKEDFLALLPADVAHKVSILAERYNPTHSVGLLCNYLYRAPLKRDICYRDILTMSDLVALAEGFSAEEKEAMFADLHRKGVPAQFAGIRKIPQYLLWKTGRI